MNFKNGDPLFFFDDSEFTGQENCEIVLLAVAMAECVSFSPRKYCSQEQSYVQLAGNSEHLQNKKVTPTKAMFL